MRFPENLKKGGTIGFVAPSFGCTTEPYKSAFANAQKKWKEMGYQLDLGPNCYAEHGIGIARRADLARFKDRESLALMRAVKHAIDPSNVMNPRVLFE